MPAPVPVLLMVRALDLGGTERQLSALARSLDRAGFTPHVGCFRAEGVRLAELETAGVPIARFDVHSLRSPSLLAGAAQMRRYIRRNGIRLVHAFDYPAILFGIPVARTCPSVVVVSSQRYHRSLRPGWPHRLLRITDHMADAIVVNCQYLARHMIAEEGAPAGLIHLCYNGIDTAEFRPVPDAPRIREVAGASLVIGVACALRPEKNLATLVDAFARVRPLRAGMKLLLVGDGSCKPVLEAQARRLGISSDCVFLPGAQAVAPCLGSMDIVVLPSISEALSNSLMEAMACGCAVVASNIGGNVELVSEGRTGLLFDPLDTSRLAAALESLIESESLRRDLSEAGCRFMLQQFSLESSARRMEEIYTTLLERKPRRAP
ncbi:MAG: glycosyltransferase family 4 protein [Bryobacteraceae bacterium]|jgi:glycosyltransferase involved in cell wall biosynthesis